MENKKVYLQIISAIKSGKTFFLSGHKKPDGDTVASELAMASLLRRMHKKWDIYNAETVPLNLSFLPGVQKIKTSKNVTQNYDVAFIFECSGPERMGNIIDLKKRVKTVINIDHHLLHGFFGDINLINVKASSNSEQLFYLFNLLKLPLTTEEATYLYVGITADTGRFRHSNTNAETLWIASELLKCGVEPAILSEKMFETRELPALKLLSHCLKDMKLFEKNKIAAMKIERQDFLNTKSTDEDTEEIVNYGLMVPTTLISILFRQYNSADPVKVSFRARRGANVCQLAQQFGGGGHKYASGCEVKDSLENVMKRILNAAKKAV